MIEHGSHPTLPSAGQESSGPFLVLRRVEATDGVNPAVDSVQPPASNPSGDAAPGQAGREQLTRRDHTVLLRRDAGEP
jgi:hypothetical protein